MEHIINEIFSNITYGILEPVSSGLFGILPIVIRVAIIIAVFSLIVGFSSMQRGTKIGIIVGLVVIAFLVPYIPEIISTALGLGGGGADAPLAADVAATAPAASPGTLSELTA